MVNVSSIPEETVGNCDIVPDGFTVVTNLGLFNPK